MSKVKDEYASALADYVKAGERLDKAEDDLINWVCTKLSAKDRSVIEKVRKNPTAREKIVEQIMGYDEESGGEAE